jgi:hypothetical protein
MSELPVTGQSGAGTRTRRRPPELIRGDYGPTYILATTEEDALAFALDYYGERSAVEFSGWMHDVGWDRENYDFRRNFITESGYGSWWEGCHVLADTQETAKLRRAFTVRRLPAEVAGA